MTAMRRLSGLLQFLIGFILGVSLFVGGISLAGYFLFNRFATNPEKPVFPEEKPKTEEPVAKDADKKETKETDKADAEKPKAEASPKPTPTPTQSRQITRAIVAATETQTVGSHLPASKSSRYHQDPRVNNAFETNPRRTREPRHLV